MVSLCQGQQQVLFYSSHAFGFFSPSQVDLQCPFFSLQALLLVVSSWGPCADLTLCILQVPTMHGLEQSTLWLGHGARILVRASALATSATLETELLTRTGRVLLALQDGDVLVYATTRGKSKAAICNCYCKAHGPWIDSHGSWRLIHTYLLVHNCTVGNQLFQFTVTNDLRLASWFERSMNRGSSNTLTSCFSQKTLDLFALFIWYYHNPPQSVSSDPGLWPCVEVPACFGPAFQATQLQRLATCSSKCFRFSLLPYPTCPTQGANSKILHWYADIWWYMMIWDMICSLCIHLIIKFL